MRKLGLFLVVLSSVSGMRFTVSSEVHAIGIEGIVFAKKVAKKIKAQTQTESFREQMRVVRGRRENQRLLQESQLRQAAEENPNQLESILPQMPHALIGLMTTYLGPSQACQVASLPNVSAQQREFNHAFPSYDAFDEQFVVIPEGVLPNGVAVASFETGRFPVTNQIWTEIMEDGMQHACPTCPKTEVTWENRDGSPAEIQEFLTKLNQKTASMGCTYDLPDDPQLWYTIRADVTGTNTDLYSTGVNAQNVNEYVTYVDNSNQQIQPVGQKKFNAFGIELGNVQKISKTPYDPADPNWGRSVRGGGWSYADFYAESDYRHNMSIGSRDDDMGFSLVRTCR